MTNPNHCPPELVLAGIIRQVVGKHDLSPDALAEAILKHPGSCWGPAVTPTNGHKLPVPTNTELEDNFRAWFKAEYGIEYSGGLALCDAKAAIVAWVKHLLQQGAQPAAPMPSHQDFIDFACEQKHWKAWLKPGGCLENAHFELSHLIQVAIKKWGFQSAVVISPEAGYEQIPDDVDPEQRPPDAQRIDGEWWVPCYGANSLAKVLEQVQPPALAAPWPELPEKPPLPKGICQNTWLTGFDQGWQAARAELQRQREQAQPPPPAAWPEISDSLIRRLVGDIAAIASETTIAVCSGKHVDPIKEARACLLEVIELAAKENKE